MTEPIVVATRQMVGALACVLVAFSASAQVAGPLGPLTLEAAVARALDANPALAAARLRRAVDLARVAVARERPNPELHVELTRETPKEAYGLALPIELGHKRERRIALGEADVRTGEAEVTDVIIDVRSAVRRAYFAHAVSVARLTLQDDLLSLATRARDATQARFDAGSAPRLETLQAQLGLAQAENDAADAKAEVAATRVRLNALLDWPLDATVTLATPLDGPSPPAREGAVTVARAGSAELALLDRRIDAQRLRIELARASYVPDLTPEATLTRNGDPEFHTGWRVAAAIGLPVFTRRRGAVQVEEAALAQLSAERQAAVTRITAEVASVALLADAAHQRYLRYRDQVLPQALEVERIAEDSYRLGQTGITALLQALQATREARLRSLEAASDFHNALADLERAIGAPLP